MGGVAALAAILGYWITKERAPREEVTIDAAGDVVQPAAVDARVGDGLAKELGSLGHEARDWNGRVDELTGEAAAFWMSPPADEKPEDAAAILAWVEKGGTLFVGPAHSLAVREALARWVEIVPEDAPASAIPTDRIVPHESGSWRYRVVTGEERVEFPETIEEVAIPGPLRVADVTRENSLLFPREGLGLVAEIVHGDGNLVVFPEVGMLSDEGLKSASNSALLASLVEDWVPKGAAVRIQK